MTLDLQKLTLRRLLDTTDHSLYTKLNNKYFTGASLFLFDKIQRFYKANMRLPSVEEFSSIKKDLALQDYLTSQILSDENKSDTIQNEFLVSQLQDFAVREETLSFLDTFLDKFDELESVEIIDLLQSHLLDLNKAIPIIDECYDIADLDIIPQGDSFTLYPSGLSAEYDAYNGGFALQELVLLGGRRGSGKSIISLNMAKNRYEQNSTVAFFTIEMRYKEVYDRLMSMTSEVPFLDIFRNKLTPLQKIQIAESKIDFVYEKDKRTEDLLKELRESQDFEKFEKAFNYKKPPCKNHKLFIIDDESLTLNRIDHYCNTFSNKYPNFNMIVVDYLNIISNPDGKDWMAQVLVADELKRISRKYDLTVLSPYQIDATGEARFSKGILDAADRSFTFFPPDNAQGGQDDQITLHTTKIRNGKKMSFTVLMNWDCVKINPAISEKINEQAHKAVMYGSDKKEKENDLS